jgi:prepilin peptidase CpaA
MTEMHQRWIGVLLVTGVAALLDWRSGQIPDWIVGLGLAFGVGAPAVVLASAHPLQALMHVGAAVAGFVACGAVPLLLFRLKALGGGDVKLLATLGALLGPTLGLELSFAAFVVAAVYWPARFVLARIERPSELRLAIAFAPCSFVAAIALTASHWRT